MSNGWGKEMQWEEFGAFVDDEEEQYKSTIDLDLSLLLQPKDYYRILEVKYDATEERIRSNYIHLALKWHPDKKKGEDRSTTRFQEINEAYKVLSDPAKRRAYDREILPQIQDYNFIDYLNQHKGLILTCNGLGIR